MQTYYYKGIDGYEHHYSTKGEADRAAAGYAKRNRATTYVYVSHTAYDKYFGDAATGRPRISRVTSAKGYSKNPAKMTPSQRMAYVRSFRKNPATVAAPAMVTVTAKSNPVITKKMISESAKRLGNVEAKFNNDYGEWRVNFKPGREGTAYYTDDAEDAYWTMLKMSEQKDNRSINGRFKKNPATFGRSVMAQTKYSALPYTAWFRNAKSTIIGKHKKSRVTRSRKPVAARSPDHYTVSFARPYVRGGGNSRPGYEIVDNLNKREAEAFVRQAKNFGLKEVRMY